MEPELRHLRYFLTVAEELHFGRAAARLQIAQPPLSQQIRRLEGAIGVELFHRNKRRVALSAAGTALVPYAQRAQREVDRGIEAARRASRGETGALTIGFIEAAADSILPEAVRGFIAEYPRVDLALREMPVPEQIAGLRSGAVDIAIVRPPAGAGEMRAERVLDERLLVAVPISHPLATRKRLAPSSLADLPLILLARDVVPGLRNEIIGLHVKHQIVPHVAQEASSIQAVLGLVATGLGVSLLPDSVRSLNREGVVFVTLTSSPRLSLVVISRNDDHSPLTKAFLAALRKAAGRTRRTTAA